jgi:predicted PurR-regulated permease PerM
MSAEPATNQWSPLTRLVVAGLLVFLVGLFIYTVRPLIGPLVVAALVAYILSPLAHAVHGRFRISYRWAVTVVYLLFLALLIATPSTLVPILIRQAQRLSVFLAFIETRFAQLLAYEFQALGQEIRLDQVWADFLELSIDSLAPAAADAFQVIEITSVSLAWLLVILVSTYYLLLDWHNLRAWLIGLAPPEEQPSLHRLVNEIDVIWRTYLQGTLALMFIVGMSLIVIGAIIGLPGALAIGLLTGLLSMIPELGLILAGILAVLVAYFQGSHLLPIPNAWFALLVAIIYLTVRQIQASWLRPYFMGRFLHLNTGLIFVAIVGAIVIGNVLVALIILPVMGTLGVVGHYLRSRLLDEDPWPEDREPTLAERLIEVQEREKAILANRRKRFRYRRNKTKGEQQLHS